MSVFRRVLVIGTGLMGTSLGLALQRMGVEVFLEDHDPANLQLASSLGAGQKFFSYGEQPAFDLVVAGVPPRALPVVVTDALERFPQAVVTDLGSVKAPIAHEIARLDPAVAARYVGGHPMAGSEQSGPLAARSDLFDGRAWAITPHPASSPDAVAAVEALAKTCGAFPVRLTPDEHDEAVALVSHLPQVASTVVAGLLTDAAEQHLVLAGQGLRDVTRIAAGDPRLWTQILEANARPVARLLHEAARELTRIADNLDNEETVPGGADGGGGDGASADRGDPEPIGVVHGSLTRGVSGVRRLPGKHGSRKPEEFTTVTVLLADRPGELARLFADVGSGGVNIEDVRIDHSPGVSAGLVELFVLAESESALLATLEEHGWALHG